MKIIIVGAGVSGLSLYLQFRKLLSPTSHSVLVYEAQSRVREAQGQKSNPASSESTAGQVDVYNDLTDSAFVVGNSIALSPHAMHLLKYIDENLHELFETTGYKNEAYTFKSARGHTLAVTATADARFPGQYTVSCPRYRLWTCLHDIVGEDNIRHKKVVAVDLEGKRPIVKFSDATEEDADLVVGADGVHSVVKEALFGEENKTIFAPRFEGFCGVGSFITTDIPASVTTKKSMVFTFGPEGSFGYCSASPVGQRSLGWWSNWGVSTVPTHNVLDREAIGEQLRARHGHWKDPVIQQVIETMSTDRIYPIWTTPRLPYWHRNGAVLLGDAAHTLQATSGQGAGQALEDSVAFSLLLAHYVRRTEAAECVLSVQDAIERSAHGLYAIRSARVAAIKERARRLYPSIKPIRNVLLEYLYYAHIYVSVNFPNIGKFIIGNVFKEVEDCDVVEQVTKYLKNEVD